MAIETEIYVGAKELNAFKENVYRWWKQRSAAWRERYAPDPQAFVDNEAKMFRRGKRPAGYYERMAEKVDYVSPLAMETELMWERARLERKRELETYFGSSFKRLEGYAPADGLWRQAMGAAEKGEMSVGEIGQWLHGALQAVEAKAASEWISRETQKRLAEEGRRTSAELVQRKVIAQRRAKGEL